MTSLEEESIDLLNQGHFQITDLGPLHGPIHGFSVRRDDKLALILETEAAPDAKSAAVQYPDGTVRLNTDQVELANIAGIRAVLVGVQTHTVMTVHDGPHRSVLKEVAGVHQMTVTPSDLEKATYTVEWLDNLPDSPFIWPDSLRSVIETTTTSSIALSKDGIIISRSNRRESVGDAAAKLTVAGETLYVCALGREDPGAVIRPGCIVYVGKPDDLFRKKIRTALSFALGVYLVELGHTLYDQEWHIVSATSRSAYSLTRRAFDLAPTPLAPLGNRGFQYDLDRAELTRMVNALVADYEILKLGNLSWAYWHACAATIHIAPAHFGAAIEALQRAYIESYPGTIAPRILASAQWKKLQAAIACVITGATIPEDSKRALRDKLRGINQMPQRTILKAVLQAISIELGAGEDAAWKRRNNAAHGLPIPEGDELAAIRDMKLLRGLFHRMLLRISNAADSYVDYASLNNPCRRLEEPVPPMLSVTNK
jgi:hypothetical protein